MIALLRPALVLLLITTVVYLSVSSYLIRGKADQLRKVGAGEPADLARYARSIRPRLFFWIYVLPYAGLILLISFTEIL